MISKYALNILKLEFVKTYHFNELRNDFVVAIVLIK